MHIYLGETPRRSRRQIYLDLYRFKSLTCQYPPTKATALGAKGCGEAGTIGISAAIMNAINDALEPFGVEANAQPFTPEKILRALGKLD